MPAVRGRSGTARFFPPWPTSPFLWQAGLDSSVSWIPGRLRGIGPLTRWLRARRTLAAQLVHMTDTHDLRSAECLDSYSQISDPVTEPPCGGGVVTCSVCRDLSPLG